MSEETLFTAARRAVRFFNIDMNRGGLVTPETELALDQLDKQVQAEARRQRTDHLPPEQET